MSTLKLWMLRLMQYIGRFLKWFAILFKSNSYYLFLFFSISFHSIKYRNSCNIYSTINSFKVSRLQSFLTGIKDIMR